MCRMLGAVGPLREAAPLVASFRREAQDGARLTETRGHRDGWGIVAGAPPAHAGRSAKDAFDDPAFPEAAAKVARDGRGVALVHLRAASAGTVSVENAHPFVGDGLAFCHNGTVHGIAPPDRSDTRAYFERILRERRAGATPAEALRSVATSLAKEPSRFSSITALLTDGTTLWGVRRVGEEPTECADRGCALAYYDLAVARVGGLTVLAQERRALPPGATWESVPDGSLVEIGSDGAARIGPLA
ncbi:MAG TPA: class II glutamine amidotransferase [Candidatus Thermoplasmatota archaeon]|nr:class II glutamine amidotransferase [Candidatus Thermoplasmatota archaeon]